MLALLAACVKSDEKIVKRFVLSFRLHEDIVWIFKKIDDKSERYLYLIQTMIELAMNETSASKYFLNAGVQQPVFLNLRLTYRIYKKENKLVADVDFNGNPIEDIEVKY